MNRKLAAIREQILHKQSVLNAARIQLKKEFIGLDKIIDEVMDSISAWYLFPDMQEKPVIINLWGLTGVGKSALIERVAALTGFNEKYYHFDLGERETGSRVLKDKLEEIYDNANGFPILIALDEFQHARTLDSAGQEIEKYASRVIWQLLDSGKFQVSRYSFQAADIYTLMRKLQFVLRNGVTVYRGMVTGRVDYFVRQMNIEAELESREETNKLRAKSAKNTGQKRPPVPFVALHNHEAIYEINKERFESPFEVGLLLKKLDGYETLSFLSEVLLYANSPRIVDCSKSVIFVIGNLDEAYSMSGNFNPDIDADEFHQQSLKITVPDIKAALTRRFRSEQIARLGNNHIIYPALSRDTYKRIIDLELDKISGNVFKQQGLSIQFDTTIKELIYNEGVYPAQGTRPLFTTIHQIVKTKLGRVVTELIINKIAASEIVFKATDRSVLIEYGKGRDPVYSLNIPQQFNLKKLRENKKDDMQSIIAVHEAGHALVSTLLLRTIPDVIFSNTAGVNGGGFVVIDNKWDYISKKEMAKRLAVLLAGLAAEKTIFGDDNVTSGASEDIEKATEFITTMLKQSGFGDVPAAYHTKHHNTRFYLHDINNTINNQAESLLKSAMKLAEDTLNKQKTLLLKMADYLSDNRSMSKDQIKEMVQLYARDFSIDEIIENGDHLFYRNHLKSAVAKVEHYELVGPGKVFELNNGQATLNNIPSKAVNS